LKETHETERNSPEDQNVAGGLGKMGRGWWGLSCNKKKKKKKRKKKKKKRKKKKKNGSFPGDCGFRTKKLVQVLGRISCSCFRREKGTENKPFSLLRDGEGFTLWQIAWDFEQSQLNQVG